MATKKETPVAKPKAATGLTPSVYASWTVPQVRSALDQHENGSFALSAMLAEALFRDDRIFATIDSRVLAALGLPFVVDPSEETTNAKLAKRLAKRVYPWWFTAFPEAQWAEVLRWQLVMGFLIAEQTFEQVKGEERPSLHVHHPQFIQWRPYPENRFFLSTLDGPIPVTPGDGRWVLFAPFGSQRPWMNGALRALAIPYLMRAFAKRDWARRSEIEGVGIKKAKVPRNAEDDVLDEFLNQVRRLGAESTIRLPDGYDVELLVTQASEGGADGFSKLIAFCDSAITLTVLGQNLTTQVDTGSYAAATVHEGVQLNRLKADVAMLSTTARQQIIVPWGRLNVPDFDPDLAPWPRWDATQPEDLQKYGAALQTLAQALPALKNAGVDITPILHRYDLDLVDKTNETPPPADTDPNEQTPAPSEADDGGDDSGNVPASKDPAVG